MVQFIRLTALLVTLASLVLLAEAGQKSCRQCDCIVTVSGSDRKEKTKDSIIAVMDGKTGGDEFTWTKDPTWSWQGSSYGAEIHVPRLCGNGGKMTKSYRYDWPGSWSHHYVMLDCTCHPSVKCLEGSKCQNSGL